MANRYIKRCSVLLCVEDVKGKLQRGTTSYHVGCVLSIPKGSKFEDAQHTSTMENRGEYPQNQNNNPNRTPDDQAISFREHIPRNQSVRGLRQFYTPCYVALRMVLKIWV